MSRDSDILKHIQVYIHDIESFIKGFGYEQFHGDRKTMQAVCYAVLNIGELTKELSDEIKDRHKNIPWKQIKGMRDRAAHGYHFLSPDIIWDVVKADIPVLKTAILQELSLLQPENK